MAPIFSERERTPPFVSKNIVSNSWTHNVLDSQQRQKVVNSQVKILTLMQRPNFDGRVNFYNCQSFQLKISSISRPHALYAQESHIADLEDFSAGDFGAAARLSRHYWATHSNNLK